MEKIQRKINKILFALQQLGFYYKVNKISFFSEKSNKYCKKYELYIQIEVENINEESGEKEKKKKYLKVLNTFDQVELLKYLLSDLDDYRNELKKDEDD